MEHSEARVIRYAALFLHLSWLGETFLFLARPLEAKLIILACLVLSLRFVWGLTGLEPAPLWRRCGLILGGIALAGMGCAAAGAGMDRYISWLICAGTLPLVYLPDFWAMGLALTALAVAVIETRLLMPGGFYAGVLHHTLEFAIIWYLARFGLAQLRARRAEATNLERAHVSTTLLAQANLQLQEYAEEVRQLATVEERNRLARDMHDILGHTLTAIIMQIGGTLELLVSSPRDVREHLEAVREVARTGLQEVRQSMEKMRAPLLDRQRGRGLWARAAATFAETTGVEVFVKIDEEFDDLEETIDELVYRVIQEGLTNAVRHGHAEQVEIAVRWEAGYILVRISDNGHGVEHMHQGFGLQGLRERTESLHGKLFCRSAPGWGFDLGLEIPWPRGDRQDEHPGIGRRRSEAGPGRPGADAERGRTGS